jgi:UDP-N-acetylglucosamine--N-acetylmuramyl-(pentapeptide) pyrophosphoryl-undecaprenol N-acetylglucosamine transferase
MAKKIVFTGGGTAGHVTPNLALIDLLQGDGWQIDYIGSNHSIEKTMITATNIPYHSISSGKLRRYFNWKNFSDPFKILYGIIQSFFLLRRLEANIVFSKGGFVAFPVVVAAWLNRIPCIAHESDLSPGLANRLSFPFVSKICLNFEPAKTHFKNMNKVEVTGSPIRKELFLGNMQKGLAICGFNTERPCLMIVGGSQGANALNQCIRQSLERLTQHYQVIHLCGKDKVASAYLNVSGYFQMEYADKELPDLFAASDLIISRAGANSLCEILALGKPHILVPLPRKASRGDQIQNAHYFQQMGISQIIWEEQLSPDTLIAAITQVEQEKQEIIEKINALNIRSAGNKIVTIIKEEAC